jgi:nickel superoxide dismutase
MQVEDGIASEGMVRTHDAEYFHNPTCGRGHTLASTTASTSVSAMTPRCRESTPWCGSSLSSQTPGAPVRVSRTSATRLTTSAPSGKRARTRSPARASRAYDTKSRSPACSVGSIDLIDVSAHCDLPCGVYDPAQARIEAESIKAIIAKVADNDDPDFRTRAIVIKEQRSELVKHHLWVLWTDYFKPPHFEKYPELHTLVNEATKLAGASGTKGELDAAKADELLAKIDEIAEIFWETKKA